ncbi:uncharacterized protein E5676_scaffold595G00710 [Cucumis melo var. makuwa]|uniref:RNase H type-1 domain-containing protein n=1 Tax=Cucumis melo var. makuwa TaxID=1194695 RepID=A0A5A7VMF9_CUCMM|nr:uncharacterized protein E6C27_scaffold550G001080 [Cucumis melo var. makuwa]TYK30244.1 uncharacterized protein E5676_scaffold595G00710 [Cucumis melo var. makuwa]
MEPWIMFFDSAARRSRAGVGIVFISLEKHMWPYSFTLGELCSNNVAKYQALIIGLQMASEFGIKCIEIFDDSKLIINQLSYQYKVKHQDLKSYFSYARRLMDRFDSIILEHIPRSENKKADVLANLATALTVLEDILINISFCQKWIVPSIENYLEHGKLPTGPRHRAEIRRRAVRFIYYKDTLYRRLYEGLLLRCLGKEESTKALEEAHSGVTPYSLVYGVEAVLALEREIPSLRMAIQEGLTTEDNAKLRLQELEALDEKILEAQQALKCYQARMSKAFDKQVRPRSFQVGDLVLALRRPIIMTRHMGNKFRPK